MFNNVALDVFTGLVFVFLLYSLLATILQEMLAQWFALRSRLLVRAIRRMLEDEQNTKDSYWKHSTFRGFIDSLLTLFSRFFYPIRPDENFIQAFYDHPTVKYLGENRLFKKPAYLNADNFSQTVIQLLRGDEYDGRMESESTVISRALETNSLEVKPETLRHLRLLFADSRRDSMLFKLKLEHWFEETMQRCTGWYKKQTQVILLLVGFCLAWSFNVDAIAISKILVKDKGAREQLVQLAISRQKAYGNIVDSVSKPADSTRLTAVKESSANVFFDTTYKNLQRDAETVQGILGLKRVPGSADSSACTPIIQSLDSLIARQTNSAAKEKWAGIRKKVIADCLVTSKKSPYQQSTFLMVIGWLITALAISLGAGFWFDMLNKVIKLRGAGTKPATDTAGSGTNPAAMGKDSGGKIIKG